MDDQVLMRVLDGGADVDEQLEPLAEVELSLIAVLIERLAFDVLHDQVRLAILRLACIDQARDVRMIEARENLPLGTEAHAEIGGGRAIDNFDGDLS